METEAGGYRGGLSGASAVIAGAAMAGAGLMHLAQAPMHAEHSAAHGAALLAVGALDLGWSATWWQGRSPLRAQLGIALATLAIVLYVISRFLPLPFEGRPEELEILGVTTQILEVAVLISLARSALSRSGAGLRRRLVLTAGVSTLLAAALFAAASLAAAGLGQTA